MRPKVRRDEDFTFSGTTTVIDRKRLYQKPEIGFLENLESMAAGACEEEGGKESSAGGCGGNLRS